MAVKRLIKFGLVFVSGVTIGSIVCRINISRKIASHNVTSYECDYDDIEIAQRALEAINDEIYIYGFVTVNDVADITGVGACYSGQFYGWTVPGSFKIVKAGSKYILRASKPVKLENY